MFGYLLGSHRCKLCDAELLLLILWRYKVIYLSLHKCAEANAINYLVWNDSVYAVKIKE